MLNFYQIIITTLAITTLVAWFNTLTLKLPTTIAMMGSTLFCSLLIIALNAISWVPLFAQTALQSVVEVNFAHLLLQGMLGPLLFAGSLTIEMAWLKRYRLEITILAGLGTLLSTICLGILCFSVMRWLEMPITFLQALLFGAVVSPTDPIAVLAMIKELNGSKILEILMAGESLFNDGMGIVLFLCLSALLFGKTPLTVVGVAELFVIEVLGGLLFGVILGALACWLIRGCHDPKLHILITIVLTTAGYQLADLLHFSGPLAMVAAGIAFSYYGASFTARETHAHLFEFWELLDEILNAILFLWLGLELLRIPWQNHWLLVGIAAIPMSLLARTVATGLPMWCFKQYRNYPKGTTRLLIWGGLRGGLAVALALSLPQSPIRDLILVMTYSIVIFAIMIQGLTVKPLMRALA